MATLGLSHVYGMKSAVGGASAQFFSEHGVIYAAGRNVVLCDCQRRFQKYIPATPGMEGVSAIALSANRRFVAIAERGGTERPPSLSITDVFTLKRRKDLLPADAGGPGWSAAAASAAAAAANAPAAGTAGGTAGPGAAAIGDGAAQGQAPGSAGSLAAALAAAQQSKEFVSAAFSADAKYVVAQAGAPDWTLYCWAWEKGKGFNAKSANREGMTAVQVLFAPADSTLVSVCGNGLYRLYRCGEGALKPLPVPPSTAKQLLTQSFVCHCWVTDERVAAATASGELLVFEQAEYRATVPLPAGAPAITCLSPVSKGFICGDAAGSVHLYEATGDASYFRLRASCSIGGLSLAPAAKKSDGGADDGASGPSGPGQASALSTRVVHVAPSVTEGTIAAVLENNELHLLALNTTTAVVKRDEAYAGLPRSCHSQQITGLDVCLRKPLVVTSSTDRTIRVFNYRSNTVDIHKAFPQEAYSVAVHPMGNQLLIGFVDKLSFANLLLDDIQIVYEIDLKGCREVRFNNGGNLMAAVQGQNIYLYSSYTLELVGTLKGHSQRIRSIWFSSDDTRIVSAAADGAIYLWDVMRLRRLQDSVVMRTVQFGAVCCSADASIVYAAGSDRTLKEFVEWQVKAEFSADSAVTALAISHAVPGASGSQLLFAGTSTGAVRVYRTPVHSSGILQAAGPSGAGPAAGGEATSVSEILCHTGPVARLRVSRDNGLVFSAGEDGTVFVLDVRDPSGKIRSLQELDFSDEVLVTKAILEEHQVTLSESRNRLAEREREHADQLKLREIGHAERLREITERHAKDVELAAARYEALSREKDALEASYKDKLTKQTSESQRRIEELEHKYQSKIVSEGERYTSLASKKTEMQETYDSQLRGTRDSHARELAEAQAQWEARLKRADDEIRALKEERAQLIEEHNAHRKRLEEDADAELAEHKSLMETRLANETEAHIATKNSREAQAKRVKMIQKELEDQRKEAVDQQQHISELEEQVQQLEKERDLQQLEMREWDSTVREKDKRIAELKRQATELEKFRFVLDFKIQELTAQVAPLNAEIASQREQIRKMNEELGANHKKFNDLTFTITTQRQKIGALTKELGDQRKRSTERDTLIKRFQADVHAGARHLQDFAKLKECIRLLYVRYGAADAGEAEDASQSTDVHEELARQRDHLERALDTLQRKAAKEAEILHKENTRIMRENVGLIAELNELRREVKDTRTALKERDLGVPSRVMPSIEMQRMMELQKEEGGCGEVVVSFLRKG
eukprot:m51a1_g13873 hypothetical protein (1264) ;mRNA; f:630439-634590